MGAISSQPLEHLLLQHFATLLRIQSLGDGGEGVCALCTVTEVLSSMSQFRSPAAPFDSARLCHPSKLGPNLTASSFVTSLGSVLFPSIQTAQPLTPPASSAVLITVNAPQRPQHSPHSPSRPGEKH